MLKGIPHIISADLLKILAEMGEGDEILLAGANFGASSHAKRLVRYSGVNIEALLPAILQVFPLAVDAMGSAFLLAYKDDTLWPPIWEFYRHLLSAVQPKSKISFIDHKEFYQKADNAFAIVATTEQALFSSIILRKK